MEIFQTVYQQDWQPPLPESSAAQIVFAFGDRNAIQKTALRQRLQSVFSGAEIVGCTTSGEILGADIFDDSICLTAITFDQSKVRVASASVKQFENGQALACHLVKQLPPNGLKHVFVLSDGQLVNGSELVEGFDIHLPKEVLVTGGLAGDGDRFSETVVWHNDNLGSGLVTVIGLYGEHLQIGHGHLGGWRTFGPERLITKSKDNVLYEFDDKPALDLYKQFLGEHAQNLPASALLFPLALKQEGEETLVRTILTIDDDSKAMVFAGNMPEGAHCQLMRANYENLVDGANHAVVNALNSMTETSPQLAILISCVGRRLVLNQRIEEELETIEDVLPTQCGVLGFFRPKTTIIAESPAIRGLQEGIAFSEVHIYTNFG